MSTCRRKLLDRALNKAVGLMKGRVLDRGGVRDNKRSSFFLTLDQVESWEYVNSNADTQPDYICDAAKIPLEDQSIDTVVMTEVLEYLKSPREALKEIFRLLTPNGVCLISTPLFYPIHGDWQFDRQRWTSVKLEEVCSDIGFEEIQVMPMGGFWAVLHDLLHVKWGLSHPRKNYLYVKILRKLLYVCTPFFLILDGMTKDKRYINSGYFVVLRKPSGSR